MKRLIKYTARICFRTAVALGILTLVYFFCGFTLPYIPEEGENQKKADSVTIFVLSNGVHTDIALPLISKTKDWSTVFPRDTFCIKDTCYNYVGFGWGNKEFYLNTPEWSDLKLSTAFRAGFGIGETAMHVKYLKAPRKISGNCAAITVSAKKYSDLVKYIEESFRVNKGAVTRITHPGYGNHDLFYEAEGKYTMFRTCNVWTNKALKKAGVKTGVWTPFAKGLMRSIH